MGNNHSEFLRYALDLESSGSTDIRSGTDPVATTTMKTISDSSTAKLYPASATVMKVSSSSTVDTSAGTGAQTVLLIGLNEDYAITQEVVTLNGQTAVETETTYIRLHDLRVLTVGSGGINAGNINVGTGTVTTGVPAVLHEFALAGIGRSRGCNYTVPGGSQGAMVMITVGAEKLADVKFALYVRLDGGPWVQEARLPIFSGTENFPLPLPFIIPAKADIELRAQTDTGTAEVNGRFDMLILSA